MRWLQGETALSVRDLNTEMWTHKQDSEAGELKDDLIGSLGEFSNR